MVIAFLLYRGSVECYSDLERGVPILLLAPSRLEKLHSLLPILKQLNRFSNHFEQLLS